MPAKLSVSGIHVTSFQSHMEYDVYVWTCVYVNVVLSSGTNMVPEVCMTSTTWRLRLLQHLPSLMVHHLHLWCTSRDVLGTVSCVGCPGTRHHVWSCTATTYSAPPAVTYEASPPVAPAVTYMCEAPMVESAPAVTYGATPAVTYGSPDMSYFPPPLVAPAVTYMGEAASVATAHAVTYGAPPVVTYSGPSAVTYSPQPQVAPVVTYMGAVPVAPAPASMYSAVPQVPPAVAYMDEAGKVAPAPAVTYF